MLQGQFQSLLCQLLMLEPPTMRFSEGCQRCLAHSPMQLSATDISMLLSATGYNTVADPGGPAPPLIFRPNWGQRGWKKCFWRLSPPLISGSGWPPPPLPPPYLKAWIHHCNIYTYMSLRLYVVIEKKNNNNNNYKERSKIGINLPCIIILDM